MLDYLKQVSSDFSHEFSAGDWLGNMGDMNEYADKNIGNIADNEPEAAEEIAHDTADEIIREIEKCIKIVNLISV